MNYNRKGIREVKITNIWCLVVVVLKWRLSLEALKLHWHYTNIGTDSGIDNEPGIHTGTGTPDADAGTDMDTETDTETETETETETDTETDTDDTDIETDAATDTDADDGH